MRICPSGHSSRYGNAISRWVIHGLAISTITITQHCMLGGQIWCAPLQPESVLLKQSDLTFKARSEGSQQHHTSLNTSATHKHALTHVRGAPESIDSKQSRMVVHGTCASTSSSSVLRIVF